MMSRLNQLNNRLAPSVVDGALRVSPAAFGYWVPSSPMPRAALCEPDHRQPSAAENPVLAEGFDGVLAARRREPTCGQPQRRDGVAIQLDQEDEGAGDHRRAPSSRCAFFSATRSCCSRRTETAYLLLGSARMTIRSAGSRSSITERATCRSRRATQWRCTDPPTDFETTRPTLGPSSSNAAHRHACTTMSGCAARTPRLTVAPNSVDRVIRLRAGSTALDPASYYAVSLRRPLPRRLATIARPALVRIRSRNPCTRARRR